MKEPQVPPIPGNRSPVTPTRQQQQAPKQSPSTLTIHKTKTAKSSIEKPPKVSGSGIKRRPKASPTKQPMESGSSRIPPPFTMGPSMLSGGMLNSTADLSFSSDLFQNQSDLSLLAYASTLNNMANPTGTCHQRNMNNSMGFMQQLMGTSVQSPANLLTPAPTATLLDASKPVSNNCFAAVAAEKHKNRSDSNISTTSTISDSMLPRMEHVDAHTQLLNSFLFHHAPQQQQQQQQQQHQKQQHQQQQQQNHQQTQKQHQLMNQSLPNQSQSMEMSPPSQTRVNQSGSHVLNPLAPSTVFSEISSRGAGVLPVSLPANLMNQSIPKRNPGIQQQQQQQHANRQLPFQLQQQKSGTSHDPTLPTPLQQIPTRQDWSAQYAMLMGCQEPFYEDYWSDYFGLQVYNQVSSGRQFLFYTPSGIQQTTAKTQPQNLQQNPQQQNQQQPQPHQAMHEGLTMLPFLTKILFESQLGPC